MVRRPVEPAVRPVPDEHQRAVVDHPGGPLLVLAGPGTGKTTTLVESVAARIERGTPPDEILVLTFSRKAAVELRDRIAARIGAGAEAPQATTFHAYCYALVRAHQEPGLFSEPVRLLSGPEQDVMVRDLLAGAAEDARAGAEPGGPAGRVWPDELRAALTTRGFADEVRAVLARARELGLGPEALARFADSAGRPDWRAAAGFFADYLDVLDLQGTLDYAELVQRAVRLAEDPEIGERLRPSHRVVYVDEYQDTDPAQVRLLQALAGGGRDLVAVGDPDQSVYAFRGADVNGILDFPHAFPKADGSPADVRVLGVSRRAGELLTAVSREVARRLPVGRLPAAALERHRGLRAARPGGRAEVYTYPTPGAELDNIADLLRRAHLEDGIPWGDMAVVVRSAQHSVPALRRALTTAGVPVETDADLLPLRQEPAVSPLLTALRVCAEPTAGGEEPPRPDEAQPDELRSDESRPDESQPGERQQPDEPRPAERPLWPALSVETARQLLTGPLAGLDAGELRRLGRALREEERNAIRASGEAARPPRPAEQLVRDALAEPERMVALDRSVTSRALHLGLLLRKVRDMLLGGATAEEALWALWDGSERWRNRLESAALRGSGAGARNADRDLDAVCALFEAASRAEERVGGRGALNFLTELESQEIAAETLARSARRGAVRPDAVRLLTAHRSKGLEWRLVVVAGVQEGLWPDLRRRGSLLEADRIGREGLSEPLARGSLLAEERRLFYVAVTRARERLVVTAVRAQAEDGDEPSRFLRELYREQPDGDRWPAVRVAEVAHRPRRPLSVPALVAELRATSVDPAAAPALRAAAAERLARLAALTDEEGTPLVPSAHPDRWWGLEDSTENANPVRDPDQPLRLSGSSLGQVNDCALRWFLDREVRADSSTSAAQGFGNVVHVLAEEVGSGRTPPDADVLMARLDTVWDALAFDAPWKSEQEKAEARAALERFLRWHASPRGRSPVAVEHPFEVTVKIGDRLVELRGSMDRVERDEDGRVHVVDFKTGAQKPTAAEVAEHPQLGVYQLAVREGALDGVPGVDAGAGSGGAELVHLRLTAGAKAPDEPAVQAQDPLGEGDFVERLLGEAADRVLNERFTPTPGDGCARCAFRRACSAHPEGRGVVP
ncbi:ATP-dependent helicase [Phaeacidiphilus oryzae]|uniref:ATP-dependent helicase n=1 Tax=Phaeacidiphilus oryzae TaxID=348818 RepID=UPI0007C69254|nr:ATP-dependent DNA helicase [Phaeacidiphilus oryzae]